MCRRAQGAGRGAVYRRRWVRDRAPGVAAAGYVERRHGVGRVHEKIFSTDAHGRRRPGRCGEDPDVSARGPVTWTGEIDRDLDSESLKATRADVRPGLAAAFVEDAFDAELLRLVDDVCVVRTGPGGVLLLFKKK